jgi:hypothetical protein
MSPTDLSFTLPPRVVMARAMTVTNTAPIIFRVGIRPHSATGKGTDTVDVVGNLAYNRLLRTTWAGEAIACLAPLNIDEIFIEFPEAPLPSERSPDLRPAPEIARAFSRLALRASLLAADFALPSPLPQMATIVLAKPSTSTSGRPLPRDWRRSTRPLLIGSRQPGIGGATSRRCLLNTNRNPSLRTSASPSRAASPISPNERPPVRPVPPARPT